MAVNPRAWLLGAAGCGAAFCALLLLAYLSSGARWLDASALQGFVGLQRPAVSSLSGRLASIGDPFPVVLAGGALSAVALARGRPRAAALVVAMIGLTSVSSQVLKTLLAYPRYDGFIDGAQIRPAAFPSGHSTAAMALAIALVIVVPRRLRLAAAVLGTGLAVGVSFSIVSLGRHFPSDVVGGYLLAAGWALVLLGGLRWADERWPERHTRTLLAARSRALAERVTALGIAAALGVGAALIVAAAAFVALRRPDFLEYTRHHTAFVAVAGAIALAALTLLGALAGTLTRR